MNFSVLNRNICKLLILLSFVVSCKSDKKNDCDAFNTFSKEELKKVWIDADAVISYQSQLVGNPNIFYSEHDTLLFLNNLGDSICFESDNSIQKIYSPCVRPLRAKSSLVTNEDSFVKGMSVWIENSTIHEEPISNFCNIRFSDGEEYNLRFILNDTTKINYSYDSNGQNNNSIQSYLVVSTDTYIDASTTVSDCLRFTFLNNDKTERICIYFSNKYGFLKITKLGNYEIKKIF